MNDMTASTVSKNKRIKPAFWFVVLGSALWGVDPLFRIILLDSLTSTQIVLLEHVILVLFMAPVLWKHRTQLKQLRLRHVGACCLFHGAVRLLPRFCSRRGLNWAI